MVDKFQGWVVSASRSLEKTSPLSSGSEIYADTLSLLQRCLVSQGKIETRAILQRVGGGLSFFEVQSVSSVFDSLGISQNAALFEAASSIAERFIWGEGGAESATLPDAASLVGLLRCARVVAHLVKALFVLRTVARFDESDWHIAQYLRESIVANDGVVHLDQSMLPSNLEKRSGDVLNSLRAMQVELPNCVVEVSPTIWRLQNLLPDEDVDKLSNA